MVQARTAFSMCTGAGTAEMARSLIQKYFNEQGYDMNIKTVAMWEWNERCHSIIASNLSWCEQVTGHREAPHLFSDIESLNPQSCYRGDFKSLSYSEKRDRILGSEMHCLQKCERCCDDLCPVPAADFGVSGLPCQDMSRAGARAMREGRTNTVYLTHAKYNRINRTPVMVIECTPDLDMGMVEDCHGPEYDFYQTMMQPQDCGHAGVSRQRTYVIGVHNQRSVVLHDPWCLQDVLKTKLCDRVTWPSDYLVATPTEIQLEAEAKARARKVVYQPHSTDLTYLLSTRELMALDQYEQEYFNRIGVPATLDEDLIVFLGDNPGYSLTWSLNGKIPCYRVNAKSGLHWSPRFQRFLTSKEKLATLGWPVTPEICTSMRAPIIPTLDVKRASDLAGNGMHLSNVGTAQILALTCFGLASSTAGSCSMDLDFQ
ncbi:Uncharacterized protein SCF082_LOCUS19629 [Durusdinium trenchii]|uniref:Uncharacterized protein n=1 Tax=Durusdinium trenchii TaxID=1381693 RepID=A0ABP0KX00_9DINO